MTTPVTAGGRPAPIEAGTTDPGPRIDWPAATHEPETP